jgi:hypothetical protein
MAPKSIAMLLAMTLKDEGLNKDEISKRLRALPNLTKTRKCQILKAIFDNKACYSNRFQAIQKI